MLHHPLIALFLGVAAFALGQSDASAKVEPGSSGRQAASTSSAPVSAVAAESRFGAAATLRTSRGFVGADWGGGYGRAVSGGREEGG